METVLAPSSIWYVTGRVSRLNCARNHTHAIFPFTLSCVIVILAMSLSKYSCHLTNNTILKTSRADKHSFRCCAHTLQTQYCTIFMYKPQNMVWFWNNKSINVQLQTATHHHLYCKYTCAAHIIYKDGVSLNSSLGYKLTERVRRQKEGRLEKLTY